MHWHVDENGAPAIRLITTRGVCDRAAGPAPARSHGGDCPLVATQRAWRSATFCLVPPCANEPAAGCSFARRASVSARASQMPARDEVRAQIRSPPRARIRRAKRERRVEGAQRPDIVRCESLPGAAGTPASVRQRERGVSRWRVPGYGTVGLCPRRNACRAVLTLVADGVVEGTGGAPAGGGAVRLSGSAGARCRSESAGSRPDGGAGPRSRP
jgi:hypothetical protein